MSRRHKETEIIKNYKPQQMETHNDGHLNDMSDIKSKGYNISNAIMDIFTRLEHKKLRDYVEKLATDLFIGLSNHEIIFDGKYLKIPLSFIECLGDGWLEYFRMCRDGKTEDKPKISKRGRNPIKQLFKTISDSKVMEFFHDTWDAVKKKCKELYENVTQFSVCFLHGSHKAFSPNDDPYGKLSHYYEMVKAEVGDFPERKTLNNYNNWFVNWRPVVINEGPKEKKLRYRHGMWQQLIEWIYYYLLQKAPEYAVQLQKG